MAKFRVGSAKLEATISFRKPHDGVQTVCTRQTTCDGFAAPSYFRYSARCAYLPFSIFFVGKLDLFLGRWTVELVGPGGRAVLKAIKPENLRI